MNASDEMPKDDALEGRNFLPNNSAPPRTTPLPMDDFMGAFVKASEPSAAASDLAEQSRRLRLVSHPASTVSIDLSIRSPTLTLTLP